MVRKTAALTSNATSRRVTGMEHAGMRMNEQALTPPLALGPLLRLGKPRVVSLIVFTAVIGMFLAAPGGPAAAPLFFGAIGIALVEIGRAHV